MFHNILYRYIWSKPGGSFIPTNVHVTVHSAVLSVVVFYKV